MRALHVFGKTLRETRRDLLIVVLTVAFGPFFVALEWFAFPALTPTYQLALVDLDNGRGASLAAAIDGIRDASGQPLLEVIEVAERVQAEALVATRGAAALVVVPEGFGEAIARHRTEAEAPPASLIIGGDLTETSYLLAAVVASAGLEGWLAEELGRASPVVIEEVALGSSGGRSEFELYVPGLFVFAVILLVFQAAMTVARDVEAGTLRRLALTRLTSLDYLLGTSGVLLLVALASVLATYATAAGLGFVSEGPWWLAVVVLAVAAASIIGIGLAVAAFARNPAAAFVLANFPMGVLMFFSGAMFPVPRIEWFEAFGRGWGPFDVLPTTHAVEALRRIFILGAGPSDVAVELTALVVLSGACFAAGVGLVQRHLRRA